ncbi:hypothetical protein PM035_08220 [Halorubrum ezzemoulense]|uniref:hypothetical protein n=1 Tax=Halorubrum ezzemoulense TaxID=337243 RepID=UPI00232CD63C|nr:hypothetical protein [Halorubrum ezzemoulense]MDB2261553.1 hypothetical protein [Halorubrum ezzemoulense]MDB2267684.1 hypothetical protein [Halorubrum ezzemoulense]
MKGLGAAGAATVGLSVDGGFTQDAEAIAPLIGAGLVAGSVGVGWALREFEVVGSDAPAEGLTADALEQQVYETAKTRKSTNASTIVDNQNILDGVEHTAYTDAKIAAIEELNAGSSESEVLDAAQTAANSYLATVESNLLKTWNESVNELEKLVNTVRSHSDLSLESITGFPDGHSITVAYNPVDRTLYDGSSLTVREIDIDTSSNDTSGTTSSIISPLDPRVGEGSVDAGYDFTWTTSSGDVDYLSTQPSGDAGDWYEIYNSLSTLQSDLLDGISTWVTNVYGDVQSGDIEIDDLVMPRERAAMMAEGEGTSQAIADLIALNVPVDPEREATITIEDTGATLPGTFALTDSSDGPLEAGTTYDPSTFTGDVYFTADMSLVEGDWSAINTSVDGGTITITSEPYEGTAIEVTTVAGETVSVPAGDWSAVDGSETWTYDASGDLKTSITEVDSARFVSTATDTQYETLQLDGSFTVDKLVNTQSGEEVTSTTFENSEPQDDSNYITQDEWDQLEQQNQELIEKYENSQSGGGIDLGQFDLFGIPGEIVAVVAAALVALGVLSN